MSHFSQHLKHVSRWDLNQTRRVFYNSFYHCAIQYTDLVQRWLKSKRTSNILFPKTGGTRTYGKFLKFLIKINCWTLMNEINYSQLYAVRHTIFHGNDMSTKLLSYSSFVCLIKLFHMHRYYLPDDNKINVWSSEFMTVDILSTVINVTANCKHLRLGLPGGVSNIQKLKRTRKHRRW